MLWSDWASTNFLRFFHALKTSPRKARKAAERGTRVPSAVFLDHKSAFLIFLQNWVGTPFLFGLIRI